MQTIPAILLTAALFLLTSWVGFAVGGQYVPLLWLMIFGTALWAAKDSAKIQLSRYKSGISYGPFILFSWSAITLGSHVSMVSIHALQD